MREQHTPDRATFSRKWYELFFAMNAFPDAPLELRPLRAPPTLSWAVPGSKSITNRALMLAALADGSSTLTGVLDSDDTRHMRRGLEALGIAIEDRDATSWVVHGGVARLRAPAQALFVGNSGTTVRFLAALACFVPGRVTLEGDEAMAKRPISDLVETLRTLGARVESPTGCPPLTIHGGARLSGEARLRADRSSQYLSALLLSGGLAEAPLTLRLEGQLVSEPYVEITRRMAIDFGGKIEARGTTFVVHPARYRAQTYAIEPDASSASYPFALAAASGGRITVPGLSRSALQGDVKFVELLERVGAEVSSDGRSLTLTGSGRRAIEADMRHISDTVMTLAAIAPLLEGKTTIRNVGNIRIKETDRLAATAAELERLGQRVETGSDWLSVEPAPVRPALVRCYGDHRMAMAFTVLGLLTPGVSIEQPDCVAKTYPGFWQSVARCYEAEGSRPPW